jgi:hypothetical protein
MAKVVLFHYFFSFFAYVLVNPVDIYFRKSLRPTDLSYDLKINANSILNVTTGVCSSLFLRFRD